MFSSIFDIAFLLFRFNYAVSDFRKVSRVMTQTSPETESSRQSSRYGNHERHLKSCGAAASAGVVAMFPIAYGANSIRARALMDY